MTLTNTAEQKIEIPLVEEETQKDPNARWLDPIRVHYEVFHLLGIDLLGKKGWKAYSRRLRKAQAKGQHPFFTDVKKMLGSLSEDGLKTFMKGRLFSDARWGFFFGGHFALDSLIIGRDDGSKNIATSKKAANPIQMQRKSIEMREILGESVKAIINKTIPKPPEGDENAAFAYEKLCSILSELSIVVTMSDRAPKGLIDKAKTALLSELSRDNRGELREFIQPICYYWAAEATFRIAESHALSIPNRHFHILVSSSKKFSVGEELEISKKLFAVYKKAAEAEYKKMNIQDEHGNLIPFDESWIIEPNVPMCPYAEGNVPRPDNLPPLRVYGAVNCRVVDGDYIHRYLTKQGLEGVGEYAAKILSRELASAGTKVARSSSNLTYAQLMEVLGVARDLGIILFKGKLDNIDLTSEDGGMTWTNSSGYRFDHSKEITILSVSSENEAIDRLVNQWFNWMLETSNKDTAYISRLAGKSYTKWIVAPKEKKKKGAITSLRFRNQVSDLGSAVLDKGESIDITDPSEQAYLELRSCLHSRFVRIRARMGTRAYWHAKELQKPVPRLYKISDYRAKAIIDHDLAERAEDDLALLLATFAKKFARLQSNRDRLRSHRVESEYIAYYDAKGLGEPIPRFGIRKNLMTRVADLRAVCESLMPGVLTLALADGDAATNLIDFIELNTISDETVENF